MAFSMQSIRDVRHSTLSLILLVAFVRFMDVRGTILSIAQELAENLNAERCTIRVREENKMKLVAVYGINADTREEEVEIAGTIVGEAFISGQIINIPDITKDRRYDKSYIVQDSQKALLAIPLRLDKDILGVAQVYSKEPFSAKEISLAQTLSQFVALVLYHGQFRRTSHEGILRVVEAIIEGHTFEEISMRTAEQITKNLEVERCTVYRILEKVKTSFSSNTLTPTAVNSSPSILR